MWLTAVQNEFRQGTLSEESHAFLHGYPTMKPGSVVAGIARCHNRKCNNRISAATKHLKFDDVFAKKNYANGMLRLQDTTRFSKVSGR